MENPISFLGRFGVAIGKLGCAVVAIFAIFIAVIRVAVLFAIAAAAAIAVLQLASHDRNIVLIAAVPVWIVAGVVAVFARKLIRTGSYIVFTTAAYVTFAVLFLGYGFTAAMAMALMATGVFLLVLWLLAYANDAAQHHWDKTTLRDKDRHSSFND